MDISLKHFSADGLKKRFNAPSFSEWYDGMKNIQWEYERESDGLFLVVDYSTVFYEFEMGVSDETAKTLRTRKFLWKNKRPKKEFNRTTLEAWYNANVEKANETLNEKSPIAAETPAPMVLDTPNDDTPQAAPNA